VSDTYAVGAVAQRVGVATPTLRTWERRYGLGPSARTSGGHRRYTREDVSRIASMHRLITAGMSPHSAAAAVRAAGLNGDASDIVADHVAGTGNGKPADADRRIRGLVRAAQDFDALRLEEDISTCLRELGVIASWSDVLVPMLRLVGDRWASGQLGVESEHLASASVTSVLLAYGASVGTPSARPARVLLACAEDETHALPLVALQAALLEHGRRPHMLGAAVPQASLFAAVARTGPRVVFLWSSRPETARRTSYTDLPARRRPVEVLLGGPGWQSAAKTPGVRLVDSLAAAVSAVTELVPREAD